MLRFGFFEDFKESDALLIWGDSEGLSKLQQLFVRFSTRAETRATLNAMEWARGLPGIALEFQVGGNELRVDRSANGVAIIGRGAAERFAEFASKIATLADPTCQSGHQYLEWPATSDVQVIVSKGEHPEEFGAAN